MPSRQSWVTIPREQLTMADKLLIWGTKEGQLLWSPVFVNLETQSNAAQRGVGRHTAGRVGVAEGLGQQTLTSHLQ